MLACVVSQPCPEVTIGEVLRNTPVERTSALNSYRLSEITAGFATIIDCRELPEYGVPSDILSREGDFAVTQQIALHSLRAGAEGIIVPSATRLGDNLVIFPDNMRPGSQIEVITSRDPVLYVEKSDD